ncbi:hypothetical protein GRS96_19150 (plasmid) [Rathayibacter sp. VKM Ac-2803]|uniref:Uncharacterized protein n=1 Tax=Rathayibacter caricis DSM 15933 TaxID=1328867 RepID=A0A2T4UNW3_9MICO|nr:MULTISPECIES: hypothetical protein [Rathayibacter]MWV51392.1 hypothetical protein [Rathayibacter sp. VKM Ac-2803]PTL71219.1 hypothetical protein C1I63_18435 [Rathayibacter caricis DSM 15933]
MSFRDESQQDTIRVLEDLIAAFSGPHWVHPAHAEQVLTHATDLLGVAQNFGSPRRLRMPTLMWPRSAVFEIPDPPPVPPSAL